MTDSGDLPDRFTDRAPEKKPEQSSSSDESMSPNTSIQSDRSEPVQNVKEEWNGRYLYVPDEIDDRLDDVWTELEFWCKSDLDWEPQKNRHLYPVLMVMGLEWLEELERDDVNEFKAIAERLERME